MLWKGIVVVAGLVGGAILALFIAQALLYSSGVVGPDGSVVEDVRTGHPYR